MDTTAKKPKIAVISDLHLGVHSNSAIWHNIALNWANWFKTELKKHHIKDIVFCGDWHHNRSEISVNTLQVSADILDILQEFNIFAIPGNHDMYFKHRTDVTSLSIFKNRKNITIYDKLTTVEWFDKVISFCPWNTVISDIPKSDIIFGHFEVETFKINNTKICEEGIKVKDLLAKSKLTLTGHFHTRHEKVYGAGTILYVGNPFQMDFGDAGNSKGYHLLDIETGDYEFIENTISPLYEKISLSELVYEGSLTPRIKQIVTNNIIKLKVDKNICQEDMTVLTNKLSLLKPESITIDYDINFNRILDETKQKEDLSGIDVSQAIVDFINLLDIVNKKDIIDYTVELYRKCS